MFRTLLLVLLTLCPSLALAGPGTLAVLYFDNQGNPELAPLKVGLAQMLITDLRGTEGVTVVERAQLQAVLDELQLGHSGVADKGTAAQVGKLLGAEWILMGGYFELAGTLRIDARLVKVETGEILTAQGVNGSTPEFLDLEKRIATALGQDLRVRAGGQPAILPTTTPSGTRDKPQPPQQGHTTTQVLVRHAANTVDAAIAYSEGLIFLDGKEIARAREAFEKALVQDPALLAAKAELAALDL